jgi:hypothetical protein
MQHRHAYLHLDVYPHPELVQYALQHHPHLNTSLSTCPSPPPGLIKYALQHGYAITPIYTFGESESYRTFTGLLRLRLRINQWGIPTVAFWGEPLLPPFPIRRTKVVTCVGPPLQLPKLDNQRPDEIAAWHARYLTELWALFDKHKGACGKPDAELEIW